MSHQGESATPAFRETIRDLRNRHPAPGPDPGAVDEAFNQSMASLSAQLAARFDKYPPTNDVRSREEGRIAAPRVDRPRIDRQINPPEEARPARWRRSGLLIGLLAGSLVIAIAAGGLAFFPATKPPPPAPAPPKVAAALPSPPPATDTRPAILDPAPSPPPRAEPVAPPPPPPPPPVDVPLGRGEILDVQTRLKALGLNPGPLDGVAGPMTVAAAKRYAESRGRSAAGAVDRELLRALQQESR